jgi:hypothetical protein
VKRSSLRSLVVSLSLAFALPLVASAQSKVKPPPRLPPNASETSRIPAGVDTGSPATSDAEQLGTPVPPNASADRGELKTKSAAARAAARPKQVASGADCTRKLAPTAADDAKAGAASLPKVSLTGNPARPSTAASSALAPGPTRIDC